MKRVYIIHGWDGYPEENWFPWLRTELEKHGFKVYVPQLPDAGNPKIRNWIPVLARIVGKADKDTYFVGHSIGCQAIVRYLESLPAKTKVGGAVFVAGFFKRLTNLEVDEEVRTTAKSWLETPLDLGKVKSHLPKSVAIFSDDDPFVPLDNQDDFRDKLGTKVRVEHGKGHFNSKAGITELPLVLEELLKMVPISSK